MTTTLTTIISGYHGIQSSFIYISDQSLNNISHKMRELKCCNFRDGFYQTHVHMEPIIGSPCLSFHPSVRPSTFLKPCEDLVKIVNVVKT